MLVEIETHFSLFSMISCKISWRNPGGILPIFLQEILCFSMKSIHFAFTTHFSPAFRQEIFLGNFLLLHEVLGFALSGSFSMGQDMCVFVFTSTVPVSSHDNN